jgi:hypothetical protein
MDQFRYRLDGRAAFLVRGRPVIFDGVCKGGWARWPDVECLAPVQVDTESGEEDMRKPNRRS